MRHRHSAVCLLLALLLTSCAHGIAPTTSAMPDASPASTERGNSDFLAANLDRSANPAVDFFQYANGGWLKRHPIPASESAWGIGNAVNDELYLNLRRINEQSASVAATARSPEQQKIGDFWSTAMDTANTERRGVEPLRAELTRIDGVRTPQDALDVAFALRPLGIAAFFNVSVNQDEKASDVMSVHLTQEGLGMPDRDYYVNADTSVARTRREYVAHLARTFMLLGQDESSANAAAADVMAFETSLAKASRKLEDLRDPIANYNKMATASVARTLTPDIDWTARLAAWKLRPDSVVVGQPEFFKTVDSLVMATPVAVLRNYLRYQLVTTYSSYLSSPFDLEEFRFYGQTLSGQKERRVRWKRVLDAEGSAMGMVLGKIFVKEFFPETAKKRYVDLVQNIRDAYRDRITRLAWMSDSTKAKAFQKLAAVTPKVGYPDKWKDYSALVIGRESYATNMMNAERWRYDDMLSKYGKPVDRTEWRMNPQTYNAYYSPSNNEIVLPAAIFMIPGIADSLVDDAVVYGYAGASTIGHELTHGFDDEGRQFDAAGNLTDWWTKDDAEKFQARAAVMAKQFDAYEPLPGLHINGKASLGENIADYGGILLGLDAFKKTAQYREGKTIGGLTPVQRYFLGYALGWLSQQQDASLRRGLLSDVHAPAKWRVLGPMANIPEFYEAFGVKPGQPMWRAEADRVQIW